LKFHINPKPTIYDLGLIGSSRQKRRLTCSLSLRGDIRFDQAEILFDHLQGGPAKVRPTYIFAGNIIECVDKIQ